MQLPHCHGSEFFTRVAVTLDGCVVHCEKRQRSQVVDPHWQPTNLKQFCRSFGDLQTPWLRDWPRNDHFALFQEQTDGSPKPLLRQSGLLLIPRQRGMISSQWWRTERGGRASV